MTFRPHTAGLNQAITSICWVGLFVPPWLPNKTGHYPLWDEVKFIDWDPHWYSRRVKEAIHIRLHVTTSTGTVELRFLKHGCLQWDNITADRYHNGSMRDLFSPLILPTMLRTETRHPWARFVIHQSQTTTVVQIVRLSKSTLSPDEDLQWVVKMSRSKSKWQSWRQTIN